MNAMLLLTSDHTTFRRDLRELLERDGFIVAGETPHGSGAVRLSRELKPDLTLIDLSVPDMGGVDATQAILDADPSARVLILARSAEEDEREVLDGLLAGACGYLFKDAEPDEIIAGVRAAVEGEPLISPAIATRLVERLREQRRRARVQAPPKPPPLTRRERDVLRLLAQGCENSAIADELVISRATVKTHVAHLLRKLGLDNRVQAAVFAVRHGIV
jgi:DNA-binding NarL/FixJ family response regulator